MSTSSDSVPPFPGAIPPPKGVIADPAHAVNKREGTWIASNTIMLVIPTILVFLRLYIKLFLIKTNMTVEYLLITGYLCFVGVIAIGYPMLSEGHIGVHGWDLYPATFSRFLELINIQQIIYMPAILFVKVSILVQIFQIFTAAKYSARWYTIVTVIVLNVVFFTTYIFLSIFQCVPREAIWNPRIKGRCNDVIKQQIASGTINVVDDFIILILPILWVWKLQMRASRKISLTFVFAVGFFACISSVMRLTYSSLSLYNKDVTYTLFPTSLWASAEIGSAIVVCCLPVLPRLFRGGSTSGYKQYSDYTGATASSGRTMPYHTTNNMELQTGDTQSTKHLRDDLESGGVEAEVEAGLDRYYVNNGGIMKTMTLQQTRA